MCESSWNELVGKDFIIDELELKTARETEQDGDSCDASNDGPCSGRSTASMYLEWMTDGDITVHRQENCQPCVNQTHAVRQRILLASIVITADITGDVMMPVSNQTILL